MLPGPGGQTTRDMCEGLKCGKAGGKTVECIGWPDSATESTDGAPFGMKFRVARLAVEATM